MVAVQMSWPSVRAPLLQALAAGGVIAPALPAASQPDPLMLPSSAQELALRYVQAVSAYWRGQPAALRALERQLAACWEEGPSEPVSEPSAFSPHAAGGRGIRWHDSAAGALGFVPGRSGCYRVPVSLGATPIAGQTLRRSMTAASARGGSR